MNYLFYTINDCWKAGGRVEWLKTNTITGESTSYNELTCGLNYQANANLGDPPRDSLRLVAD